MVVPVNTVNAAMTMRPSRNRQERRRRAGWAPMMNAVACMDAWYAPVARHLDPFGSLGQGGAGEAWGARLRAAPQPMRLLVLSASVFWAGHTLLVGSVFGLACDVLTILGLGAALPRAVRDRAIAPVCARA